MKPGDGGWFGDRWELTAPESYALLYGQKGEGTQIFKLALLELVARKLLTLVDAGEDYYLFETGSVALLKPGPGKEHPRSRSLGAVLDLLDEMPIHTMRGGETGILVTELARVVRSWYGSFDNYAEIEVMPALASRDLYRHRERRFLGIHLYTRWEITHAGEATRAGFERSLSLGREQFRRWVDSEPARAFAFLGFAGSSMLLMEELHPDIRRLREREHTGGEAAFFGGTVTPLPEADLETGEGGSENAAGISFGDLDLGVFDWLDSAFSTTDSGGDSGGGAGGGADGGGWGGGDGGGWGGGDGGGGGGDGGGGGGGGGA